MLTSSTSIYEVAPIAGGAKLPDRWAWSRRVVMLMLLLLGASTVCAAGSTDEPCPNPLARVVSVQGMVEVRRARATPWQVANLDTVVCHGDSVRVLENGRAALALSNEVLVRLDHRSAITFAGPDPGSPSFIDMCRGALHFLMRSPRPIRVLTPFLNAAVEGTEFTLAHRETQDVLTVLEGRVSALNSRDRAIPQTCETLPDQVHTAGGGRAVLQAGQTASIVPGQAPAPILFARPADAVQWALYYPPVIEYGATPRDLPWQSVWAKAIEMHRAGNAPGALAAALDLAEQADDSRFYLWRAGLLLEVGRVDEAERDIGRALRIGGNDADAQALQAVVAVVRDDKEQGLSLATGAVRLRPDSPAAHIALSYAQQAHFRIEHALASARRATEMSPGSGVAWARVAELEMSTGNLGAALAAAQRAAAAAPRLSRTQTILGFAHLTRIDTAAARRAFTTAIELDSADPLPRLGLGLALIREGDLENGRKEIEIAASLDPGSSLARSYLGKAYYEEKRDELASAQFNLAKALDPRDPTPWFYEALMLQGQQRHTAAVKALENASALNENRAVFRSMLRLDQDLAARSVSLGRSYQELGLESLAATHAASSLALDPADSSAHRLLADLYQTRDRHEMARGSELLQMQLMQPLNPTGVQPRLAFGNLALIPGASAGRPGLYELTPLFERDRLQLLLSGQTGSLHTDSYEAIFNALKGPLLFSAGHFHYDTRGFRPNNDLRHDISSAFAQLGVSRNVSIQAEYRKRETESGDLKLDFDPNFFQRLNRTAIDHRALRGGATVSLTDESKVVVSVIDAKRDARALIPSPPILNLTSETTDDGQQYELAYAHGGGPMRVFGGVRAQRISTTFRNVADFTPGFGVSCVRFPPPFVQCDTTVSARKKEDSAYVYSTFEPVRGLDLVLGVARYDTGVGNFQLQRWSPKLGFRLQAAPATVLRGAFFETIKPFLAVNETLEPTQVAGVNQFFDDSNLARSRRAALAVDHRLSAQHYVGVSFSGRKIQSPAFTGNFELARFDHARERLHDAYFAWLPTTNTTVRAAFTYERFYRDAEDTLGDDPLNVRTVMLPITVHHSFSGVFFGQLSLTNVWHEVDRRPASQAPAGDDSFRVVDAALGIRLPARRGVLRLEARNLLNEKFSFYEANFFSPEPKNPRFIPARVILLSIAVTL
jgi:tetratricopeptide (TPR) repeat protein